MYQFDSIFHYRGKNYVDKWGKINQRKLYDTKLTYPPKKVRAKAVLSKTRV